jgi:hypothetical protein
MTTTNWKLFAAMLLYFAIVFGVGFLLGPIRVILIEPRLGSLAAVLIEVPLLLFAMVIVARLVPRWLNLPASISVYVGMGLGALALQQVADTLVGVYLRGLTPQQVFATYTTPAGMIYLFALLAFAAMPLLVNRHQITQLEPDQAA